MTPSRTTQTFSGEHAVSIGLARATLQANLGIPARPIGAVLFAHGSGSSRLSPRNRFVAAKLRDQGIATLLMDLLTSSEEEVDQRTAQLRFNIRLLSKRLADATAWAQRQRELGGLRIGYFGASTGAAAALVAAAQLSGKVAAVVSRGGRPDLAGDALGFVLAPTLLIVGGEDGPVIELNEQALERLACSEKKLWIVPGATHLFEEPGALEEVARVAADWFSHYFTVNARPQQQQARAS